jgi:hypothetical protein
VVVPSRPLSPDRSAQVRLHTWAGTHASKVVKRTMTRPAAVAVLSLVAPCRPDLVRAVIDRVRAGSPTATDWPPRSVQLDLLLSVEQVTLGALPLVAPDGVTVEHLTYRDKLGYTRRVLRLRRDGVLVRDCSAVEALGREIDLTSLEAGVADATRNQGRR